MYPSSWGTHCTPATSTLPSSSEKDSPRFSPWMVTSVPPSRGPATGLTWTRGKRDGPRSGRDTNNATGTSKARGPFEVERRRGSASDPGDTGGQCCLMVQRPSLPHQPHWNFLSARRHMPQLSRRAPHL
ncbi:hypothetical protein EYF80_038262 [Liparis tanakae]|uniref:Uncharacterized protein n=1 Tax=Liparis tanakae TaxID=230148 RepID=A0A4Z2GE96_9TELE|nr:hypothetical protein EYF80_038262 [Liparis tanakae]